jgi:hypothetical protein
LGFFYGHTWKVRQPIALQNASKSLIKGSKVPVTRLKYLFARTFLKPSKKVGQFHSAFCHLDYLTFYWVSVERNFMVDLTFGYITKAHVYIHF